jgi:hypothetical protein
MEAAEMKISLYSQYRTCSYEIIRDTNSACSVMPISCNEQRKSGKIKDQQI